MYVGRTSAYLRHQRERSIKRKEKIVKSVFHMSVDEYETSVRGRGQRGRLDKGKVHCSCKMCRYGKFHGIERDKVRDKLEDMKSQIDEYV